jgi:outer membrane receptor protein involved in Fe transport
MENRTIGLARAIRIVLGSAVGASAMLGSGVAGAQQAAPQSKELEEVYVTGSRIARRSDFENSSPVVSLDKDLLDKAGYGNLQQLLAKQPFAGNGTFSTRGNNQDSTANGAASISLRGLGADATLVLVNGRRVAISAFAESITTNFVDINTIPVAAIERLEVLKDGASAVYGSDAVAGVVNIILRDDFDGVEISGSYGGASGYDETRLSAIAGFGDDNSNVTIIADYFDNSTLENVERGYLGTADQSPRGGEDLRSSRGFPGSFIVDGVGRADPACPPDRLGGANCFFDYGPYNLLTPEAERFGVLLTGRLGFGDGLEVFTEIAYQNNTSIAQGAPTPLDGDAGLTVPATHPDNPFTTVNPIGIRRFRTVDAGARQWDIETDSLRGLIGLRGAWSDWNWEVAAQAGTSDSEQTGSKSQGWVRTDRLQPEITAGRYNPFGATVNPPAVIDAFTTSLKRDGESELLAFDASITGEAFELPAGKVGIAAGLEYRDESISDIPDEQFQQGLIFGTEAIAAEASREIFSAYVEAAIPLLDTLEASVALRYDDYSDFGDTVNPKIALRWAPIESVAMRASWGTGFRAPSLAQIGLGPSDESQFFEDTFGCADNPLYCGVLDYTIRFSGNPDLDAEDSESWNVGIAWRPTGELLLSVDYWDITQEGKIDEAPFGLIYDAFCDDQNSVVCVRDVPLPGDTLGPLVRINSGFENIGEQSVSGIDFSAYWSTDLAGGNLSLTFDYSHLLEFERVELNGDLDYVSRDLTGEYEYPEDRFVLGGDWAWDSWGVYAAVNYIGSFEDQPDIDFDGTLDFDENKTRSVGSFTTLNLQLRYTGFEGLTLMLGADNLLDEEPPFAIGDGDTDLYGYVSSQHDPRGQFVYGKATYRF